MDAKAIVEELFEQDQQRTRQADERSFFQVLRAALERNEQRSAARELRTRE